MWTRIAMVLNSLLLAVLISVGDIQIWHLAASSLFSGILFSFMMPAQTAILVDLVDRETLLNAISLNSIGMGLMGIGAASAAGLVIELVGAQGVYYIMAALYLWALFTLTKLPTSGGSRVVTRSVWADLKGGLRYLAHSPTILALLGLALVRVLLAMPYRTLMPKYARDVLGFDATGLGILIGAPGVGSMISSLILASLGDFQSKGKLLLGGGIVMGLALILFINGHYFPLVLFFLALVGAASNVCMVANQTLLQTNCDDGFRGRVMSMYMMMWGLTPLGTIPAGAVADHTGIPPVITAQGVLLAAIFGVILVLKPRVRRLK